MKAIRTISLYLLLIAIMLLPAILFCSFNYSDVSKTYFLGSGEKPDYFYGFIFAGLGMFAHWVVRTRKGVKYSLRTDNNFNLDYWILDNFIEKSLVILKIYVFTYLFMRFPAELLGTVKIGSFEIGGKISMCLCLFIGWFIDWLIGRAAKLEPDTVFARKENTI